MASLSIDGVIWVIGRDKISPHQFYADWFYTFNCKIITICIYHLIKGLLKGILEVPDNGYNWRMINNYDNNRDVSVIAGDQL